MTVSLLDYVDPFNLPIREKMYSELTKEVQYIDSVVSEIQKRVQKIK